MSFFGIPKPLCVSAVIKRLFAATGSDASVPIKGSRSLDMD